TSRLDLPVRDVGTGHGLVAVLAEGQLGTALGHTLALRVVLLTVLDLARDQHESGLPSGRAGRASGVTGGGSGLGLRRLGGLRLGLLLLCGPAATPTARTAPLRAVAPGGTVAGTSGGVLGTD